MAKASAGDAELRREVEALLAHDSAPVLIDHHPAAGAIGARPDHQNCLAKDPDDRWQTARDLSRELQSIGCGR